MNIKNETIAAIKKAEEAKIAKLKIQCNIYFHEASGIGEHPGIIEEIETMLKQISEAQDIIDTLDKHFSD